MSCLRVVRETMPFTYPTPMLDSDSVSRTHLPIMLLCFWFQDIVTASSHSSSYHCTRPSSSFQLSLSPSRFIRQSQEGALSPSLGPHSFLCLPVSCTIDVYGSLDYILSVVYWVEEWPQPPLPWSGGLKIASAQIIPHLSMFCGWRYLVTMG